MAASGGRSGQSGVDAIEYDLFIACAESDRPWVHGYLVPALGLSRDRLITRDDFRPGAPVLAEFERAVAASRCTAVVVSRAFLADDWSVFGELLASHASVEAGTSRVVPVIRDDARVPLHLAFRIQLDCTVESRWDGEVSRLRDLLSLPSQNGADPACPYPGMVPFGEDTGYFYGREREEEELLLRLRYGGSFFVIGPSGSGKSSLVFAGLLPRLEGARWVVRTMRPGPRPMEALGEALGEPAAGAGAPLLRRVLERWSPADRLLLVVDQLEEAFVQAAGAERQAFLAAIAALRRLDACVLVATFRADFYPDFMTSDLWPLAASERVEIAPLRGASLRRAIEEPARQVGVFLQPALVERLLSDAASEPGVLPLVQETMVLLWERRQRRLLTLDAYEALGGDSRSGLAVALATRADATLDALPAAQQEIARRVFLRLVQLGEGREDTRRQELLDALRADGEDPVVFGGTVDHLTNRRLLTLSGDSGTQRVDLAHESLIASWPTMRRWIQEDRDGLRIQRQVATDAREWERLGRDPSLLHAGTRLHADEEWAGSHPKDLTALEHAFIDASRTRQTSEALAAARTNRRLGLLVRGLAVALILALVATGAAVAETFQALNQTRVAQSEASQALSQALAAQSTSDLSGQPDRSLLLSVQAMATAPTGQAEHALFAALERDPRLLGYLHRSAAAGRGVAVSPDGRMVAAGGANGTIDLWDRRNQHSPLTIAAGTRRIDAVAFDGDGRVLVAGDDGGTVTFWDVAQRRRLGGATAHDEAVTALAFSPDGRTLASSSDDKTIVLWDTASMQPTGNPLVVYGSGAAGIAFVSGGDRLLSTGFEGVKVWDVHTRTLVTSWSQSFGSGDIAVSPDGSTAAQAGYAGATLWDALTGSHLADLNGQIGNVTSIALSPNGQTLAAAGTDGRVQLWDVARRQTIGAPIVLDASPITGLAYASDGTLVVGSGSTVSLWDQRASQYFGVALTATGETCASPYCPIASVARSPDGRLAAWSTGFDVIVWDVIHKAQVADLQPAGSVLMRGIAFSPDGHRLAAGSSAQIVFLWNVANLSAAPVVLRGPRDTVNAVAFSPDGLTLAGASDDTAITLWDLRSHHLARSISGPEALTSVAFAPDGTTLAFGAVDGSVTLWDLAAWREKGDRLRAGSSAVRAVSFDPAGRHLASAADDGTIVIWDVASGAATRSLLGHTGAVMSVAFSPSGTLASGSVDGKVILWDPATGARLGELGGGAVDSLAFDRAGRSLLAGGDDAVIWNVDAAALRDRACGMAGRNLTRAEWDQFVGAQRPYERTCAAYPSGTGVAKG